MKTIYFKILMLLPLMFTMGCDKGGTTDVYLTNEDTPIEVKGISPESGYAGENLTISGSGFSGYGTLLKVYVGERECEKVSTATGRVVVKVPEGAVSGQVSLRVVDRLIETGKNFTVKGNPLLTPMSTEGYLNGIVTFDCKGMPEEADNLSVSFGGAKAEIVKDSYLIDSEGNGTMDVKVPSRLTTGPAEVAVSLFGVKVYTGEYQVLATPFFNLTNTLAMPGSMVTLTGEGFGPFVGTDKVRIDFDGTLVAPASITATEVKVTVPQGFKGGEISAVIEGLPLIPAGTVNVLSPATDGDITAQVLQNSLQPFESANKSTVDHWLYNNAFTGPNLDLAKEPDGMIMLQAGWGCPNKENAKMYQNATLPAGSYRFELTVKECGRNSGIHNVIFAATNGKDSLPDLKEDGTPAGSVLGWTSITGTKIAYDGTTSQVYTFDIGLKEGGDVSMGFVLTQSGQSWVKISSVRVKWIK